MRENCIPYLGSLSDQGYGRIYTGERGAWKRAHVVTWESYFGPVPEGKQLDHLCRNRACCNVLHMEPVTTRENTLRGVGPTAVNARKTHCQQGHALSDGNLRVDKRGRRSCRICQRKHDATYRARNVAILRAKSLARWHRIAALAKAGR